MFPLIETAAAFAAVMLVVSLFVSALVQAIQSALGLRAAGLTDMLLTLIRNYGTIHGRGLSVEEEAAFVDAVVTHPLLHTSQAKAARGAKVLRPIEYLDQDDLVDIVKTEMSQATTRARIIQKAVADPGEFTAFVERWYETVGATTSQHFKNRMRRLTLLVSCLIVVVFNFDGIHLITDLHRDETQRSVLAHEIEAIQSTSRQLVGHRSEGGSTAGAPLPATDPAVQALTEELKSTSKILQDSNMGVGWQSSFIAGRWRAYLSGGERAPSKREMLADTLLWLAGIVFSCVMLSLGAPFWATTLGSLVNLTNAVQKAKSGPSGDGAKGPEKAGDKGKTPDSNRPSA